MDQLVQVTKVSDGSLVASYTYNADGTRRSKTTSLGTTNYDWDAFGNLVKENGPGGTYYYYYTPSGGLVAFKTNGTTYIVHANQRGDIEAVTDESGTVVAQFHYGPWGNLTSQWGSLSLPFGYAGYYLDSETGLYYCKNRYYDPALHRWLTRDEYGFIKWSNPQTLNLYSYAEDNPVSLTDPSGHIVSAWDVANLSASEIQGIQNATAAWNAAYAAGNVAGMTAAHAAADKIRISHLSSGETIDSSGYVVASSSTAAPAQSAVSASAPSTGSCPVAGSASTVSTSSSVPVTSGAVSPTCTTTASDASGFYFNRDEFIAGADELSESFMYGGLSVLAIAGEVTAPAAIVFIPMSLGLAVIGSEHMYRAFHRY